MPVRKHREFQVQHQGPSLGHKIMPQSEQRCFAQHPTFLTSTDLWFWLCLHIYATDYGINFLLSIPPPPLLLISMIMQVLDSCLESHVLRSDNSALAKDVRKEIKGLNAALMKLGPRDR